MLSALLAEAEGTIMSKEATTISSRPESEHWDTDISRLHASRRWCIQQGMTGLADRVDQVIHADSPAGSVHHPMKYIHHSWHGEVKTDGEQPDPCCTAILQGSVHTVL